MKKHDEKCPICGKVNEGLNLEETQGWMDCKYCGNSVQLLKYARFRLIPVLSEEQIVRLFSPAKNAERK